MLNLYYTLCQQARIVDISPNQALGEESAWTVAVL